MSARVATLQREGKYHMRLSNPLAPAAMALAVSLAAAPIHANPGDLFVANAIDNTIEKFTPGGVASVFASTGLHNPIGLAFDSAGNLYVALEATTRSRSSPRAGSDQYSPLG
jgi:DNA-binding beta-propeller fold protein YncE